MDTSFNIMKIASPNPDANEYEMSIKSKPIQSKKLIETSNALERVVSISVSPPPLYVLLSTIIDNIESLKDSTSVLKSKTEKNTRPRLHVVW